MNIEKPPTAAIVNYGMGNLFSVAQACRAAGMSTHLTSESRDVANSDLVILPGVGAFGSAMDRLRELDLIAPLKDRAAARRPLMGICLGMQLLLEESHEFGRHEGLGIVPGTVERLDSPMEDGRKLKVPHIGWNKICCAHPDKHRGKKYTWWSDTPLSTLKSGEYMYFVHSYRCIPRDAEMSLSTTNYGHIEFCSTLRTGEVFACQYHPERSGPAGLAIYLWLAKHVREVSAP